MGRTICLAELATFNQHGNIRGILISNGQRLAPIVAGTGPPLSLPVARYPPDAKQFLCSVIYDFLVARVNNLN